MKSNTTGESIRNARKAQNLTQAQLAQAAGIAVNSVRLYEAGKLSPKIETLKKIAAALNVSVIDLADFDTATEILADDINQISMRYGQETPQYYRMVEAFSTLNHTGAEKAAVAVEDLAKVPEYRREDDAGIRETAQDTYTDNNTSDN